MKAFWIGAILVALASLLAGCGVAQDQYEAAVKAMDAAKAQVTIVQGDLDKAKSQVMATQSDLDKTKAQATTLQSDLDKARTQATTTQNDLERAKGEIKNLRDELAGNKTKLTDLEAKNTSTTKQIDTLKEDVEKLKRLSIFKMVFVTARPDANKYTLKPDSTYRAGETVWAYAETIGFKYLVVDGKLQGSMETEFKVLNEKGDVVTRGINTIRVDAAERPSSFIWHSREYTGLRPGNYTLEMIAQDKLSGETVTTKGTFKVIP